MRIWPVIIDSNPDYLSGYGRDRSLLAIPLGTHTILERLRFWLQPLTTRPPLVISRNAATSPHGRWIRSVYPDATVVSTARELADALAPCELSDALLIIDPRCLPIRPDEFSRLVKHHSADPRMSYHCVTFETCVAGSKERVCFDSQGHVRRVVRHCGPHAWPFIAGVAATMVSVATGILADGELPASLLELRQTLTERGIPSRDVPMHGGALDLTEEAGLLAASEHVLRDSAGTTDAAVGAPIYVGSGQVIHHTARVTGRVIIHGNVQIGENVLVFGPTVIGARARISSGAVVAHAVIGPDGSVPSGGIVRNRAWFETVAEGPLRDDPTMTYGNRLARLVADVGSDETLGRHSSRAVRRGVYTSLKRVVDVTVAALSLIVLSPLLLVIAILIRLESRGSSLYGDKREGLGGRGFRCWKFRTMCAGAHAIQKDLKALDKMDGPHFKLDRDPRVTRVGRLLRALNLDELPQLFNVLCGEMSLVGPRPSPFRENQVCVPWREARLSVRPGITGFWQLCRHDRSSGDFHQWIEYDLLYVQHMSFWLDAKILIATVLTLGGKIGQVRSSWLVASASGEHAPIPSTWPPSHAAAPSVAMVVPRPPAHISDRAGRALPHFGAHEPLSVERWRGRQSKHTPGELA